MLRRLRLEINPYQPIFFSAASTAVIIKWIERGFKESEKELADIMLDLIMNTLDLAYRNESEQ